jgi:hypothetical protein
MDQETKDIIFDRYGDILEFANSLIKSSASMLDGENCNSLPRAIAVYHFAKSLNYLEAIFILSSHGHAREAMVLLRSQLNLLINFKWLLVDGSEERMTRFADFEVIIKKKTMEAIKEFGSLPYDEKTFHIHDEEFERVKKKYNLTKPKDFYAWSGKTISQMANDVGMTTHYQIVYRKTSEFDHTGPASVRDYLDDTQPPKVIVKIGPKDEYIDFVLLSSLEYFIDTKIMTMELFSLELKKSEHEKEIYREIQTKYYEKFLKANSRMPKN